MKRILSLFLAGLATLLPVYISLYELIVWLFNLVDNILKPLLEPIIGCAVPGLGFIIIIALVILWLYLTTTSARILRWWENILHNIPSWAKVYGTIKRITDSLFSSIKALSSSLGGVSPSGIFPWALF